MAFTNILPVLFIDEFYAIYQNIAPEAIFSFFFQMWFNNNVLPQKAWQIRMFSEVWDRPLKQQRAHNFSDIGCWGDNIIYKG